MPELTPNLNLKKPNWDTEVADIRVFNDNMDILDEELIKKATKTELGRIKIGETISIDENDVININPKITTPQEMTALVEKYKVKEE